MVGLRARLGLLVGCFRRLVLHVYSLAAVLALGADDAEVVAGEEFPLAGRTLPPQLGSTLSRQLGDYSDLAQKI